MKQSTKSNYTVYLIAAIANLLAFSAGIAIAWPSPVLPKLNGGVDPDKNPLGRPATPLEESSIVALLSLGGVIGPVVAGPLANNIGRRKTLILIACPMVLSLLLLAFAETVFLFLIARFISGLGVGGNFVVVPMYLTEIAEDHNRGILGCSMTFFVTSGLLFSYAVGPFISIQNFCLVCIVPLLIFIVMFYIFGPESPQYLSYIGDRTRLMTSLLKLRNKNLIDTERDMLDVLKMTQELGTNKSLKELLTSRVLRKSLMISVSLILLQQFGGIGVVLSYMQSIFDASGTQFSPAISAIITGIFQVIASVIASSLADLAGRRFLLLTSTISSGLSLMILGVYFFLKDHLFNVDSVFWLPVVTLIIFIVGVNLGLTSVPWTMMAELFPPNMKSTSASVTTGVCYLSSFFITVAFPPLSVFLGMAQSFWIFAAVCAFGTIFVYAVVPETKGKSLQEIQNILEKR